MSLVEGDESLYEAREDLNHFIEMRLPDVESNISASGVAAPPLSFSFVDQEWLGPRAIVVHNVLSTVECASVMNFMQRHQEEMVPAGSTPSYRNNTRVIVSCEAVAGVVASRVLPVLTMLGEDKKIVTNANRGEYLQNGMGMDGVWTASRINPCFRLCKYLPLGHFAPHFDGDFVVNPLTERSLKTFMIYLNDDYGAGSTNFLSPHEIYFDNERKIYASNPDHVKVRYKARQGDAIVFDHKLLHEGAQVTDGQKYIMRSDLVYTKAESCDESEKIPDHVRRAIELFSLGTKMEENKEFDQAVALYSKAFRLCPELEQFT